MQLGMSACKRGVVSMQGLMPTCRGCCRHADGGKGMSACRGVAGGWSQHAGAGIGMHMQGMVSGWGRGKGEGGGRGGSMQEGKEVSERKACVSM